MQLANKFLDKQRLKGDDEADRLVANTFADGKQTMLYGLLKLNEKEIEHQSTELNYFFVHIKTKNNEVVTIPNSHFFEKSFSILENRDNPTQSTK